MKPIEQIRRERLAELVEAEGSQANFARKISKDKNQVNQWLGNAGSRNLSASTARAIEVVCGKPTGWMDTDPGVVRPSTATVAGSQSARAQRDTMRAAARILERAREVIIGQYDENALIDSALEVTEEIGPERILSGESLLEALRMVAARIRAA